VFNLIELEDYFNLLGTPEPGRKLVEKARKQAPVRQVQSRLGNVITLYPSKKMGRVIATESRTVEYPAVITYERDPTVLEYFPQPVELDIIQIDENGKKSRFPHTPDFLILRKDGIWIEEWREEPRLVKLAAKHPGRYFREADGWHSPFAEEQLASKGISYRLRSADEHPRCFIRNMMFLGDYLEPGQQTLDEHFVQALMDKFIDRSAIHLRELLDTEGFSPDSIYQAIAQGIVAFDMMNDDIAETDRVVAFRDDTILKFHQKVATASAGALQERLDVSVEVGGIVRYDGQEFEIKVLSREKVWLKPGTGEPFEMPLNWLKDQHREGDVTVVPRPQLSGASHLALDCLNSFHQADLEVAIKRVEEIEQYSTNPNSVDCSLRTIQRRRKAMREAGETAIEQHLAVAPRYRFSGNRKRRIPQRVIELIAENAREHYNTPTGANKEWCYLDFVAACHAAGEEPCSQRTFGKELARYSSVGLREGKRRAYHDERIVHYLDLNEAIHGVRPFQYVHIDHTELQIVLRIPDSKESLGRAWLSLAIDAESRAVVGYYLSFEPPSYRSCMMVLRDIVRRHERMPEMLVLDNGKEFHSAAMQRVCRLYGCSLRYRPSAQPRSGSVMERIFGTTQSQLINNLAGNTQALRHARMATKAFLPENFVYWTLPALHGALDHYFTTLYGKEPHPAHGDGPGEHLKTRLSETGVRRNRWVFLDERFRIETCPSPVDCETRKVDNRRGVKVHHIWYWCDALRTRELEGKPVQVRVDPWDVRFVYVLVGGEWHCCRSKLAWLVSSYTEVELRYAFEEMAKKLSIKKKDTSPERIAEFMKVRNASYFDPRLAKCMAEARLVYEPLQMATVSDSSLTEVIQEVASTSTPFDNREFATTTPRKAQRKRPEPAKDYIDVPSLNVRVDERSSNDDYELM
jgi:putative transposase